MGLLYSQNEEIDDDDDVVEDSAKVNKEIGDKRKFRDETEDENIEGKEKEEEDEEEEEDGNDIGDGDHDMYVGMYETAIEMAADDDNK